MGTFNPGDLVLTPISSERLVSDGRVVGPAEVQSVEEDGMCSVNFKLGLTEELGNRYGVVGPRVGRYHEEELQHVGEALRAKYNETEPEFTADEVPQPPKKQPQLHE